MTAAVAELGPDVGTVRACAALGIARPTFYRRTRPKQAKEPKPRPKPERGLSDDEIRKVLEVLHGERFADKAPAEIYATLLDEGTYLCSIRTMYRILAEAGEVRERRDQLRHPAYTKPELLATGPNQVWSWDITKLKGPAKWTYYYLYVILDIFSRYVVGWMVAHRESAKLGGLRGNVLRGGGPDSRRRKTRLASGKGQGQERGGEQGSGGHRLLFCGKHPNGFLPEAVHDSSTRGSATRSAQRCYNP